jgi:hypothetical protein
LNQAEGVWSLLKCGIANFAAPNLDSLTRVIKRRLKKIQYRSHLLDCCLAAPASPSNPGDHVTRPHAFNLDGPGNMYRMTPSE